MLTMALVASACSPSASPAVVARDSFITLAARDPLTYRFALTGRSGDAEEPTQGEGVVVGRDSELRMEFPEGGGTRTTVIKDDRVFDRTDDGPWEVRARRGAIEGNDVSFLLPLVASTPLGTGETLEFEGQTVHQLGNLAPIEVPGDGVLPLQSIPRLELLVDDAGRPVRLVAEFVAAGDGSSLIGVLELRFFEVGAALTVTAPVVP